MCNIFNFTEENRIYRTFVLQNNILVYDTWYIYGILVGMIEHIQGTAWALILQFLLNVSSLSHGAINCHERVYDNVISEYF
jgi:hypothetical protein